LKPENTHAYESQQWVLYRQITKLKEKYYEVRREEWEPKILNAYITFRDIQARNKALEVFNRRIHTVDMKLLEEGQYSMSPAVDP
jgi:hypothetical protein